MLSNLKRKFLMIKMKSFYKKIFLINKMWLKQSAIFYNFLLLLLFFSIKSYKKIRYKN